MIFIFIKCVIMRIQKNMIIRGTWRREAPQMRGTKGTVGSTKEVGKGRTSERMTTGKSVKGTGRTSSHKGTGSVAKTTTRKGGSSK
jgi:hypothetical protein